MADLATGIFHFYADQYGVMNGKFLGNSVNLLLIHHIEPGKILKQTYWELTGGVYKFALVVFPLSLVTGFHWELLLFLIVSAQANLIHKWSHNKFENNPKIANFLFRIKLIQGREHHLNHHKGNYNNYYCVMSPIMNPILDKTYFWKGIVKLLDFMGVQTTHKHIGK